MVTGRTSSLRLVRLCGSLRKARMTPSLAAFAWYAVAKGTVPEECQEEAFDYLRDALLIAAVLRLHPAASVIDAGAALGLLVAPTLCRALGMLVTSMSPDAGMFERFPRSLRPRSSFACLPWFSTILSGLSADGRLAFRAPQGGARRY